MTGVIGARWNSDYAYAYQIIHGLHISQNLSYIAHGKIIKTITSLGKWKIMYFRNNMRKTADSSNYFYHQRLKEGSKNIYLLNFSKGYIFYERQVTTFCREGTDKNLRQFGHALVVSSKQLLCMVVTLRYMR